MPYIRPLFADFTDPKEAAEAAVRANDWLYEQIKSNTKRFGGFAALSMHDPQTAADELTRCVKEYGFLGSLVNDNQRTADDMPIFYDTPEWDVFYKACTDLDVPFYLHPIAPKGAVFEKLYKDRTPLIGPCMSFPNNVALHLTSMVSNCIMIIALGCYDNKKCLLLSEISDHQGCLRPQP